MIVLRLSKTSSTFKGLVTKIRILDNNIFSKAVFISYFRNVNGA